MWLCETLMLLLTNLAEVHTTLKVFPRGQWSGGCVSSGHVGSIGGHSSFGGGVGGRGSGSCSSNNGGTVMGWWWWGPDYYVRQLVVFYVITLCRIISLF
jgi:hypothetical protein